MGCCWRVGGAYLWCHVQPWHLRRRHRIGRGDGRTGCTAPIPSIRDQHTILPLQHQRHWRVPLGVSADDYLCLPPPCRTPLAGTCPCNSSTAGRSIHLTIPATDQGGCDVPACPAYDPSRDTQACSPRLYEDPRASWLCLVCV